MKTIALTFVLIIAFANQLWAQPDLLENPPREKAEIFAPDIVSTKDKEHSNISVSPDGLSIYWSIWEMPPDEGDEIKIVNMTMADGKWGVRRIAEFNSGSGSFCSCFWGDDKIIFRSIDVLNDFWMVKKQNGGWSEPVLMGFDAFSQETKAPYSVSGSGDIYYCSKLPGVAYETGIYVSCYKDKRHTTPILLPEKINSEYLDWTPYIAPDESFLLFSSNRPGSIGSTDLYVTFKDSTGAWSNPVNLGVKVNTESEERFPSLTPDGKILFFLRDHDREHQDFYWIDAGFIEELGKLEVEQDK